jgi:hypothetical protein
MELATTTALFLDALSGKVLDMVPEARRWSNGVIDSKLCHVSRRCKS